MSAHSSKRAPVYTNLVNESGEQLGTVGNPIITQTGGGGAAQDVHVENLPTNLTANGALKVSDYATVLGESAVETIDTNPSTFNDADIYVVQASPGNTQNIRYGNVSMSHWLMPGMQVTWYGPLTVSAPESTQDMAITKYSI